MDHLDTSPDASSLRGSRAASPGYPWRHVNDTKVVEVSGRAANNAQQVNGTMELDDMDPERPSRYRPRTFPYQRYLPYPHDDRPLENLNKYIEKLYIAVSAGDFVPGATHWTREIRGWLQLKFDLPRADRVKLVKLYYGMDSAATLILTPKFIQLPNLFRFESHSI